MERSFVSCHFEGQLGNQLFTIAATLSYAWDYDAEPFFPELNESRYRLSLHRDRLFFRLNTSSLPRPHTKEFWEKIWYSAERISYTKEDLLLFGYFHSWKHFHHHREKLLKVFAPHPDHLEDLRKKYADLIDHPKSVAIHVRTSMRKVHNVMPFLGLGYVKDAIKLFGSDTKFVVFSDRIRWVKQHLSKESVDLVFIEGGDAVDDLILMSLMKHQVIANSTFSWWGAYLNENPNKKIIAPSIVSIGAPTENLYFPDWTVLPIRVEPYPEDMYSYDAISQSMDNNE